MRAELEGQMDLTVVAAPANGESSGSSSGAAATKTQQSAQNMLDGVDNYMFTKKRRLSFVSHSGSLGEALQPPLKKYYSLSSLSHALVVAVHSNS
jgi:hypothetical protein